MVRVGSSDVGEIERDKNRIGNGVMSATKATPHLNVWQVGNRVVRLPKPSMVHSHSTNNPHSTDTHAEARTFTLYPAQCLPGEADSHHVAFDRLPH
jgi:hypothetical protein